MVLSSPIFVFLFLPITILIYYIANKKLKNVILVILSLVFLIWNSFDSLYVVGIYIILNYLLGKLIYKSNGIKKKAFLVFSIITNLIILFYFKYFNFTISIFEEIIGKTLENIRITILPLGISIYTFKAISYAIDIYTNKVLPENNIINFSLYLSSLFEITSGPISRYLDISNEITCRKFNLEDFVCGAKRFIIGLFKKVVIADTMGEIVDSIYMYLPYENNILISWLGIIAYSIQIYFDFSGYSDMAIGLGNLFGFHFKENFNYPYISKSLTEFWRRWHISLSTWFRDYVYIPLGGNKKHVYLNLLMVFLLTGFWHGAEWSFIVWGLWNAIFIIIEKALSKKVQIKQSKYLNIFRHLYLLLIVSIGWVFFRAENMEQAIIYLKSMFGVLRNETTAFDIMWYLTKRNIVILLLAIIFSTPFTNMIKSKLPKIVFLIIENLFVIVMLIISVFVMASSTYRSFIYFQF